MRQRIRTRSGTNTGVRIQKAFTHFQPEIHMVMPACCVGERLMNRPRKQRRRRRSSARAMHMKGRAQAPIALSMTATYGLLNEVEDAMASGSAARPGTLVRHLRDL